MEVEIKIPAQITEHKNIWIHVTLSYHVENFPRNNQYQMRNMRREPRAGHKADEPERKRLSI